MESPIALKSHQDILQQREEIAKKWYRALATVGGFQLDRTEALEKFSHLTDLVIAFLLAEYPQSAAAEEIGQELASLPCVDPRAVEITAQIWIRHLVESMFPVEPAALYSRFLSLFNGMATGFTGRSQEIILKDQEEIRSAMAADLRYTSEELRKYQSRLEAMLAERTQDLRESEEKFRAIAETSQEGIFQSTDDSGTLLYVNDAFAKMLGYTKEELLGRTNLSLIDRLEYPRLSLISQDLKANKPVEGEYRMIHKDGHLIDVHFSVVPTKLKGRIVRSGILQDITESKRVQEALFQSEERYRTLAEASPDMIFIVDKEDKFIYVNSFAAAFLDLPVKEIIGQPRARFFRPPTTALQRKNLQNILRTGIMLYTEIEARTHERTSWLGSWLVPLRDSSGNISGVMGVSRDITKQKQAEKEIRRSHNLLEKRVKERTADLVASQNQLRQLTNQLVTALEDERRRISRELHDQAGQALISLKYILASMEGDISESNSLGKQRLAESSEIADQVMYQIRALTHSLRPPVLEIVGIDLSLKDYCEEFSKRTRLSVHYQGEEIPGLPDEIGISFYRCVQEAFTNILKHAKASKVMVKLQKNKRQVILTVWDDGCGMENSLRSGGIGLIGIEERFKLLGGSLQIHSGTGKGVKIIASVPWSGLNG